METFRYHLRGVCISGSACRFAHCETELWARTELDKTVGACTSGSACRFAHSEADLRTTSKVSSPGFCVSINQVSVVSISFALDLLWRTGFIVADGWRQCFAKRGNSSKD